jgi:L-threonylcarbamoyladenylate synthase
MQSWRNCVAKSADYDSDTGRHFHLGVAASVLRGGGVVAHATEAVWGLACDPFNGAAVARLLDLKRRSVTKGLIVIASDATEFADELAALDEVSAARVCASWPNAETWLLPNRSFPGWITGNRAEVAVRVPGHAQARALCARFGGALVSTSANPSNRVPARTQLAVRRYFGAHLDYVLPGHVAGAAAPSRIRRAVSGATIR